MTSGPTHQKMAADIWAVADLLRGDYKRHEYGQVILPFTVMRRLDAVMAPTRETVRTRDAALTMQNKDKVLERAAGLPFYNVSKQDFATIASDATSVAKNLRDYVNGFSANVREILGQFGFDNQVTRLAEAKLLYQVVGKFAATRDLDKLSNHEMGYVFEHLIRKFAEDSNETAGEHFTPREVIELMVNLLIAPDAGTINDPGQVINILDPACGTGGMLTTAEEKIKSINPNARVFLFGQELNGESWAVCESEMLLRDQNGTVELGNSFSADKFPARKFDYMFDLDEQRSIANHLDAETARIDQLRSDQLRILELLEERANSRIIDLVGQSAIVKQGGMPIVPMRRVINKLNRPVMPTDAIITAFRDGQVTSRGIRRSEGYTLSASAEPQGQGVEVGDIVVHGLDGFAGAIGDSEASGNCSPVYHVCAPIDGGNAAFYGRLLRVLALGDYLAVFGASARERAVDFRNWKIFGHAPIPWVGPAEQHEIGNLITKIRPLREEVNRFNERLSERRQALITAAVTGGISV